MATSPKSSLSTVTLRALRDEVEKIAEDRKTKLKRWAKNTALVAGGVAAGEGAARVAEKVTRERLGSKWAAMPKGTRLNVLRPAVGAVGAGAALSAAMVKKYMDEGKSE